MVSWALDGSIRHNIHLTLRCYSPAVDRRKHVEDKQSRVKCPITYESREDPFPR